MPTTAVKRDQRQADAGDALDAEARDQAAGDKARRIHASTCHWMPSVASVTEWPQPTMASGAAVITMFIIA